MSAGTLTDIRQTINWANYLDILGWEIEKIESTYVYVRKLPLIGSLIKIQRPNNLPSLEDIEKLAKKYRAISIKIEPRNQVQASELENNGYKISNWPMLPTKTIWIDLSASPQSIFDQLPKKTRYSIRQASQNRLEVSVSNDLDVFLKIWLANMRRRGFFWQSKKPILALVKAFGNLARVVLVKKNNLTLAGVLLVLTKNIGYYMYAASTVRGNRQAAPTLAAWEAIKLAKKSGCRLFDFEGIYDPRFHASTKNWQGFSHFKKSFGGKEIDYPGVYVKSHGFLKLLGP